MKKIHFIALLAVLLFPASLWSQSIIKGRVTESANGNPLIGAAVMVKGTNNGAMSDADGVYELTVKEGDIIVCSFFGFKEMEVTVGKSSVIDFAMVEDNTVLEDAVVVGYGTMKKKQLVGAVETLSGEDLENRVNPNVTRSLQGQIAGLNIIQTDGKPNHQGKIYIRGNSTSYSSRKSMSNAGGASHSIGQGGSALILIDGVEGDLATVNPEDVASISVLKDASSAAVYGARGAFGVILVTTKNPVKDQVRVSYNGSVSFNKRTVVWEDNIVSDGLTWAENFVNFFTGDTRTPTSGGNYPSAINNRKGTFSAEYLEELRRRKQEGDPNVYGLNESGNYMYYGSTNWIDMFYKDFSTAQTHNISVSGSSERLSYSVTGRYYGQNGIYKVGDEDFNTYNLRAKGSVKIAKWLTLSNNTSVFYRDYKQPIMTSAGNHLRQIEHRGQPVYVPYNEDGTVTYYGAATGYDIFKKGDSSQEESKLDVVTITSLKFEPIKDVLKVVADFTYKGIRSQKRRASEQLAVYDAPNAKTNYNETSYLSDWRYNTNYMSSNIVLTWTPKINENHDLNLTAGWNIEDVVYRRQYTNRSGLVYPSIPSFSLSDGESFNIDEEDSYSRGLVGVFARVNYTLFNRYIFEFAARYDGSSLFPKDKQWGFFPSGSLGWRLSEEPWMKWSRNWLDNFKIRGNVGSLGNAQISPYQFLETMSVDKSSVLFDGNKEAYVVAPNPKFQNLTWETVLTYDIGLDMDFLNSRLSFSGDYYWRFTKDMYCQGPELPSIFGASTPKGNYGELKTKGWELTLGWRDGGNIGGKRFSYGIKASVWDSRSWITKYNNLNGDILSYYVGKELGEIWGFRTDGYFMSNAEADNWVKDTFHKNGSNFRAYAGDLKFIDVNGDGKIDTGAGTLDDHGDLERIGNQTPRYQYGINLDFNWNGIGLSLFFQGVGQRDWYPGCESGFFWGMYNRPYGFLMKNQLGDNVVNVDYSSSNWVVTNADKKPYWTRQVAYAANRNVGPLTWENDYYLQKASYFRLKNITLDYTFPRDLTRKIYIENLRVYFSAENLFTASPIFKHTKMFDPEVITNGDSDFSTDYGLSGIGQGYSYPMLRSFTIGLNITF